MKPWKVLLGLGAVCAACCAIPLVAAAGSMALFGSALLARLEAFVPASVLLMGGGAAVLVAGLWWRRKRRVSTQGRCGCAGSCSKEVGHASS
ncbi:hypothetical protein J7E62_31560 [Variovorax paradoxus]|nr:hypothetical protein [Variovorax paradoxus]